MREVEGDLREVRVADVREKGLELDLESLGPFEGALEPRAPRALYADSNDTVYALDDAGRVLIYSANVYMN